MVKSTAVEHSCKKSFIAPLLSVVLYLSKTLAESNFKMDFFNEIINLSQVHKKAWTPPSTTHWEMNIYSQESLVI